MKKYIKIVCILLSAVLLHISCLRDKTAVTVAELQDHIKYLSSDPLKGRETGTKGDSLAAEYIRSEFQRDGLIPVSGDGLQMFEITDKVIAGSDNMLSVDGSILKPADDFAPASFTANGSIKAEVVFAGYGFSINNDSIRWNDYTNLDVKGKWVLILRGDPEPDNTMSKYIPFSGDRDKVMIARDMGAAGVLLASGPAFDKEDIIDPPDRGELSVGIPAIMIKRQVADMILSKSETDISGQEKKINSTLKPAGFKTSATVDARTQIIQHMAKTRNVIMMLPGEDPELKNEYVIFGAHFDHLGMGGSSSSRAPDTVAVHPGADDNASGVALLIELAEKFAGTPGSHKRSLVFAAFTGEEEGLLGSKYFAEHPGIDLTRAVAMMNFDMVGRMKETKDLQIGGVGTAAGLKEMVEGFADTTKYRFALTEEGAGPSDHSSFYARNIPVLFFTTLAHDDYHKPSDSWEKINYKGMVSVSDLVFKIGERLASDSLKPEFREAGPKESAGRSTRRRGVTLGIMPDFSGVVKNGCRADLVTPGKPAANGGMKKGDIIVAINGKPVNNIYDYMFRLNQLKKGEIISVEVLRNNKKEVLIIQL